MSTKVISCNCKHESQDSMYGAGKRLANWARSLYNKFGGWRCTVCNSEQPKKNEIVIQETSTK